MHTPEEKKKKEKSASNKLNCTDYCNCEKVVYINTDAHPPELMNKDLDLELVY